MIEIVAAEKQPLSFKIFSCILLLKISYSYDMEHCKECGKECIDVEFLRRHISKSHRMTTREYTLKFELDNVVPRCKCGCDKSVTWNQLTKQFNDYLHGHAARGRKKTDEEKRKIGAKNSVNMTRYMSEHPDIAKLRSEQLQAGLTEEVVTRRNDAVRKRYDEMSVEEKEKFSVHARKLWADGTLVDAHVKAAETFKQRSANGEYDFVSRNDKISQTVTQKYLDGGFEWAHGKYVSSKTGLECYYRSSWELRYMQRLDADDTVTFWESEFTSIQYELMGEVHRYVPDFHVVRDERHELIEIKPQSLRDTPKNEAKRSVAQKYCEERGWTYVEWEPEL